MKYLSLTILVMFLACNGQPPPPPPCEADRQSWPECEATGGQWVEDESRCVCVCPDGGVFDEGRGCIIEPPPPTTPKPEDYLTLKRVGTCEDTKKFSTCTEDSIMRQLVVDLQENANRAWRSPIFVADYCPHLCADGAEPVLPLSAEEMREFGEYGEFLEHGNRQGLYFLEYLPKTNRHCDRDDPYYSRFCGRSWVRREVWKEYNDRLFAHLEESRWIDGIAQQDPIRQICAYDSAKGFCECKLGIRSIRGDP